jgi:hypothetical protein
MTYHVRKITLAESLDRPRLRQPGDDELSGILPETADDRDVGQDDERDEGPLPQKKRRTVRVKSKSAMSVDSKSLDSLPRVRWVRASSVEDEKCVIMISSAPLADLCAISLVVQH